MTDRYRRSHSTGARDTRKESSGVSSDSGSTVSVGVIGQRSPGEERSDEAIGRSVYLE